MFIIPSTTYRIRTTKRMGRGVVVTAPLVGGTVIGDFLGILQPDTTVAEFERTAQHFYSMGYDDTSSIVPDATTRGVHLLNHSCAPNCGVYPYRNHVLFFALRAIHPGEELTIGYDIDPRWCSMDATTPCVHTCVCPTPICTGTMHISTAAVAAGEALSRRVLRRPGNTWSSSRPPYGTLFTPLPHYPRQIADDPGYTLYADLARPPRRYDATRLPPYRAVRAQIRREGCGLFFPNLACTVWGVLWNGAYVSTQGRRYLSV